MKGNLATSLRYAIVGGSVAAVYLGSMTLAVEALHFSVPVATLTAVTVGSITSYVGHHRFTFRKMGGHRHHIPRFLIQVAYTYLITFLVSRQLTLWNLHYLVGVALVWIILPIVNFFVFQAWTFFEKGAATSE